MSRCGILRVYFDAFSSKSGHETTFTNDYVQSCSIDFRRCSFTGKERDEETGYGYFGARYMDHELMAMWLSVDPMADKYPSISPYAYCAWNPVILVDPDGRAFDSASLVIVNDFRSATKERMGSMGCTPEQRNEYNAALEEIAQLEESDQMYHIQNVGESYSRVKGGTYYRSDDESVCIEYDGKIGNLAHELKHAYQFEVGELSFSKEENGFGELYDITDEKAALSRGGAYDKQQFETLKNVGHAYKFRVVGDKNIDYFYPFLSKRPNSSSIVGNRTSSRTVSNAQELGIKLSNDYYRKP